MTALYRVVNPQGYTVAEYPDGATRHLAWERALQHACSLGAGAKVFHVDEHGFLVRVYPGR